MPEINKKTSNSVSIMKFYDTSLNFKVGKELGCFQDHNNFFEKSVKRMTKFISITAQIIGVENFQILKDKIIRHRVSGKIFIPVKIADRRFWVTAKGDNERLRIPRQVEEQKSSIHIVSGPCLFSKEFVKAISKDETEFLITSPHVQIDRLIKAITVNSALSLYEIESVFRLSAYINSLIKTSNVKTLFLNIPEVEYYTYVLDAYNKGYLTFQLVMDWFDRVDERHTRMVQLMRQTLISGQTEKKMSHVIRISPLSAIKNNLREQIILKQKVSFTENLKILQRDSKLWYELINAETPSSWSELNNLSYVYAELYPGFLINDTDGAHITLVVENPTEDRILIHTRNLIKKIPAVKNNNLIIGNYPHDSIIPGDEKSLYDTKCLSIHCLKQTISQKEMFREVNLMLKKLTMKSDIPFP